MTETKEPTAAEKLQAEYNQLCAMHGHIAAQMITLEKQSEENLAALTKVIRKAANLPKEKIEELKAPEAIAPEEIKEEVKDVAVS